MNAVIVDQLTQYAIAHPDGFTMPQAVRDLRLNRSAFQRAVEDLRTLCGRFDTITLVCDPAGKHQPWVYRLVGTLNEAQNWVAIQTKSIETRIDTERDVIAALLRRVDVRTIEGRRLKHTHKMLTRLHEDLADMIA